MVDLIKGGAGGTSSGATADVTYYVNADTGNDSNPGTSGSPFLTQVKAWNTVCATYGEGFIATIQLQDATASYEPLQVYPLGFGNTVSVPYGWSQIFILGHSGDRTKVLVDSALSGSQNHCYSFTASCVPPITIKDMTLIGGIGADSHGVFVNGDISVIVWNMINRDNDFLYRCDRGSLAVYGAIRMEGINVLPRNILLAQYGGRVDFEPFSGFTTDSTMTCPYFAEAHNGGQIIAFVRVIDLPTGTFSGSKFWIDSNSILYSLGFPITNLPGALPGIITDGGVFVSPQGITQDPDHRLAPAPCLDKMIVANLPATCIEGSTAFVTDSSAGPVALAAVTGGGSTHVPVIFLSGGWKYLTGTAGSSGTITVNTTAISGGTTAHVAYDNAGTFGEASNFTISSGNPQVSAGGAYKYDGVNVIIADTANNNFYFARAGNLTATGTANVGSGNHVLEVLTTGSQNLAIGDSALQNNTTGNTNVAIGPEALNHNTSGQNNLAIGAKALNTETTSSSNVAIGNNAMRNSTGGDFNVAVGQSALFSCQSTGDNNIAEGDSSLFANTTGSNNVASGANTLHDNTTGSRNTAQGATVLTHNLTGDENTGVGWFALQTTTAGNRSTGIGARAGQSATGDDNTLIGYYAGGALSTGTQNTIIASSPSFATQVSSGSQNIVIGYENLPASATASGQLVIGNYIYGTGLTGTGTTISTAKIGIGVKAPAQALDVNGGIQQKEAAALIHTAIALTGGSTANAPTLTSGPANGDPTKWIPIDDNGTTRYIPAW